jgi:transaldolase/glucose-6-phosphate isomerase
MSDVTTIEADVPERYADAVQTRLRRAADEDVVGRIWRKDGTLWAPEGTPEVTNRLGWLDIAERSREQLAEYEALRDEVLNEGYTDAIVLGMGGSSLAPEVFRLSFGHADGGLKLHVLDSTHPAEVAKYLDALDLDKTVAIVSSKSGGTIEPMSMYKAFSARMDGTHFVAVTDPGTSLENLASQAGFRRVFHGDPDIGGRYSALSAFGLVPAAAAGIDLAPILDGAIGAAEECRGEQGNAGLWLGCALGELARQGRDKLTFVVDEPLTSCSAHSP